MAEVVHHFEPTFTARSGRSYTVRVCGGLAADGLWEGWIEFEPLDGGITLRTPRETEQSDRKELEYWATGLSTVYLEGALDRALRPEAPSAPPTVERPTYDAPAPYAPSTPTPSPRRASPDAILDPFEVFASSGEEVLSAELHALGETHLRRIVEEYSLVGGELDLHAMHRNALAELIVAAVRRQAG